MDENRAMLMHCIDASFLLTNLFSLCYAVQKRVVVVKVRRQKTIILNLRWYTNCKYYANEMLSAAQLPTKRKIIWFIWFLEVALGCRASAIIYRKTRVYGDYQWIIAINASTRPLTLQPNATPSMYMYFTQDLKKFIGWIEIHPFPEQGLGSVLIRRELII